MRTALVISILAHGGALLVARPLAARYVAESPAEAPSADLWAGTSIEVSLAGPGAQNAPFDQGAAPASPATSEPSSAPARAARKATPAPAAIAAATASGSAAPKPTLRRPDGQHARKGQSKGDKASPKKGSEQTTSPGGGSGAGGTFGSEGAASVRDLGRAFTRAIPAACSADPVWGKLPAGAAGKLTAEVRVDGDGHVTSAEPIGKDLPKALVNVLRRTLPMLQGGTFAVRGGTVTAGTETLELSAVVSDEPAGGGEGAKDNLAFSYSSGHGKASFTQTGGRHVDITVRVIKVTASD